MNQEINKYPEFSRNNPFGTQAKILHHIDRLYDYIYNYEAHPIFIEINLTDKCNLNCKWCISENRGKDTIKTHNLKKFLCEFKDFGGKAVTFSGGGEPTLHKDFEEIATFAADLNLDLGLMTNGVFNSSLTKPVGLLFKWVRISLDTVDGNKYKEWKGRNRVPTVLSNILLLKDFPVKVGVNCNVSSEHDGADISELLDCVLHNVDYVQFRPVIPRFFTNEIINLNESVWDYLETIHHPKINFSNDKLKDLETQNVFPFKSCEGHYFNPILNSNGDLKVCMYHLTDERFTFGNIYENSLRPIWYSSKRKDVINFVRGLNYSENCQVCCKLCELNKFIDFIRNPNEDMDINFL